MKALVEIRVDSYRLRSGKMKDNYRLVKRDVKNIEEVTPTPELPTIHEGAKYNCYSGKTWRLYKGTIRFKKQDLTVYGWTFNSQLPLYWGGDYHYKWSSDTPSQICAWGWLYYNDDPPGYEWSRNAEIHYQRAYEMIRKHFGSEVADNYIDGE